MTRKLIPFSVELHLKDTVASLSKKLRLRLGMQGRSPRRGETTVLVRSDEPKLIDELLTKHGNRWPSLGKKNHFTLIARMRDGSFEIPSWVVVIYVHADAESPFAVFLAKLEENIASARAREIGSSCKGPLYQDELDAKQKADEEAEAARKQQLAERAADAITKLRRIILDDTIGLLEIVKPREGYVRALEEIISAFELHAPIDTVDALAWKAPQ